MLTFWHAAVTGVPAPQIHLFMASRKLRSCCITKHESTVSSGCNSDFLHLVAGRRRLQFCKRGTLHTSDHSRCVTVSVSGTSAPASPGFAPVGSLSLPSGVGFEYVLTTFTSPYIFCRLHMCGRAVLLLSCARRAALVVASCCFCTGLVVGIKAWIAQRALRHGSGDMGLTAGPQTWLLQRTHETWILQKNSGKDPQTWAL